MSRGSLLLLTLTMFAAINTGLAVVYVMNALAPVPVTNLASSSAGQSVFKFFVGASPALSTTSWVLVGGIWIWRGKVKSRWQSLGFDSGTFDLFMTMKGAETRFSLLGALLTPKDRLQLAEELGLDWKAIDYHINLFNKYGLVYEQQVTGRVKMYQLTTLGEMLLGLLRDLNREVGTNPAMNSLSPEAAKQLA